MRGSNGTAYPDTASLLDYVFPTISARQSFLLLMLISPDAVTSQISAQAGSSVDTANITLADGS